MALSTAKLEFWAKNRYNVCISGRHGVGKTGQVFELFNNLYGEIGKDWLYFSASTMDPWVDFIGVPKEKTAEDGTDFLHLVRPEIFARDRVKAIFLDEYNRAPKKVRNAVMELIQFQSINGHKFHTLEVVWTAINPPSSDGDDLNYDVDELDDAQLDRFHIFVEVPYAVSKPFFTKKYGEDNGTAAVEWWNSLPKKISDKISPRRLDYAIDCYQKCGDVRDVLPAGSNATQLLFLLSEGSIKQTLDDLLKDEDTNAAKVKMAEPNFYDMAIPIIKKDEKYLQFFMPLAPSEKLSQFISSSTKRQIDRLLKASTDSEDMFHKVTEIVEAKGIVNNKIRQLQEWRIKNFAGQLKDNDAGLSIEFDDIMNRIRSVNTARDNTYNRKQSVEELLEFVTKMPDGVELSKRQAKEFFDYMLYFASRSNKPTFGKFAKDWEHGMLRVNEMHPFAKNHTRNSLYVNNAKRKMPDFIGMEIDELFSTEDDELFSTEDIDIDALF